ncbi:MAG: hypothetical protein E4H14_06180 [Candidatus Thorarchaeota archaeon]|nr:MAG: hypothetical protein E4H14_06180 [Candidatus Thorarchaeota archaeon]
MSKSASIILAIIASVLATAGLLSPMVTVPGPSSSALAPSDCATATTQLAVLDQYGSVYVHFGTSQWAPASEASWDARFKTEMPANEYKKLVDFSTEAKGKTMCEAIDKLYYKVIEYPLPKVDWHR